MLEWLAEPLLYAFILRGLGAGLLAAVACAILSSFVVWRGWAFIGDAMSHAVFPGIVLAYMLGISLILGALATAVAAVFCIGMIQSRSKLREDSAIGIVFTGFLASGILLSGRVNTFQDLSHILFGNILGVSMEGLMIMGVVTMFILLIVGLSFKELLTASFDPAHAAAIGLSPVFIRYLLLMMLALTTVIAVQTVGVVLVLAFLVTPAATASLLTKRLGAVMLLSLIFAVLATIIGFYLSYYADLASGPVIVLVLIFFFIASMILSKLRGVIRSF